MNEFIQIENRAGKLKLNDGVYKESADKLIEELEQLYGPAAVLAQMRIGDVVCAADDALESVEVEINSPGGSVFEGNRIYNALRGMSARGVEITTTVNGLAASMGSVILMAGDKRQMTHGSRIMIHEASCMAWGDARVMRKNADLLEGISSEIAGIYAERTGSDAAAIRKLMFAETWMTADEAKQNGFVHAVVKDGKAKAELHQPFDIRTGEATPAVMNLLAKLFPGKNESEIEAALAEVDSLRTDLSAAAAEIETLKADVTAKTQTIAELGVTVETLTTAKADLETALSTASSDLAAKDETIAAKETEIAEAKASAGQIAIETLAAIGQPEPLPIEVAKPDAAAITATEIESKLSAETDPAKRTALFREYRSAIKNLK